VERQLSLDKEEYEMKFLVGKFELTNSTMIGKIDEDIIIGTTKIEKWDFKLSSKSLQIFNLSKTLPLPTPCKASFSPSNTCIKCFGVTSYLNIQTHRIRKIHITK